MPWAGWDGGPKARATGARNRCGVCGAPDIAFEIRKSHVEDAGQR